MLAASIWNDHLGRNHLDPTDTMKQAPQTADPRHSTSQSVPDSDHDSAPAGFGILTWLKYFSVYLCAVAATCAIGLYFLWQIPLPRELSQLAGSTGDPPASRPVALAKAPPAPPVSLQPASEPFANPETTVPPGPLVATADTVATLAPSDLAPATTDPNAPPPLAPTTSIPDGQTEPVLSADDAAPETPPLPTPQAEIELLLTEAQQQMDSRRLTAPASGNALRTYQRVLELESSHPAALEGIQRITEYYQDAARQSLQQGRLDEGLAYISRGLRADPQDQVLLSLRREIRLAKQREEEQRQALLEMQRQRAEREYQEQIRRRVQESQQPWWRQQPQYNDGSGFNQR